MDNTMPSPEEIREIAKSLKQPTPESTKKFDKELAAAVKLANENIKAERWPSDQLKT